MYEVSIKYVTVCLGCIDFTFVYASSAISTENCSYDYTVGLRIMKTEFRCAVFENTLRNQVTASIFKTFIVAIIKSYKTEQLIENHYVHSSIDHTLLVRITSMTKMRVCRECVE